MRVGLFSLLSDEFVNTLHEALDRMGHKLAVLVTSRYDPQGRFVSNVRLQAVAKVEPSIPIIVVNRLEPIGKALEAFDLDLILVEVFSLRLPRAILAIPRLGCVNVHPSFLPRYRGPSPIGWQLFNGEAFLGVTLHRMDVGFDTGPVLLQWRTRIGREDTPQSLRRKVHRQAIQRLPQLLRLVESGAPGTPQNDEEATYAPHFGQREWTIDWSRSAPEIANQARALGNRGALARLEGRQYRIKRAEALGRSRSTPHARAATLAPGTIVEASTDSLVISTGCGLLRATAYVAE